MGVTTSSGDTYLERAISKLVPAVFRVFRKMKRWLWDRIMIWHCAFWR